MLGQVCAAAYVLLWLHTGTGQMLQDTLTTYWTSPWLVVAGFGVTFALPFEIATFPLTVYGGYVLPHRFGQSRQTLPQWGADVAKGGAVAGVLGLVLLEGLYAILRWQPAWWWLWAAGGVLCVNLLLTHLAPVLLFPLFFRFTSLEDADLRARLMTLCDRARTQVRGVFTFDLGRKTRGANAALVGLGGTRRILLSDTLCDGYTPAEVEVVLAHELGHHLHRHLPKGIIASTIGTLLFFYITDELLHHWLTATGSTTTIADVATLPLLALVLGVLGVLSMPMGNGLSRRFEREADATALDLTSDPAAMISAMERLADHNLTDRNPHPLVTWWSASHPPIDQRIAAAQAVLHSTTPVMRRHPV